jgi:hypothetical protein
LNRKETGKDPYTLSSTDEFNKEEDRGAEDGPTILQANPLDWSSMGRATTFVHKLLPAESLAPHRAHGNAWHSTRSSAPVNDLLYVSNTTPRLSGIDVLVAYLRPHHEEYEDFSALGGSTPTHSHTDDV